VKALSIRQPWAWAILHAGKRIENRDWRSVPSYRGPLLIHASAFGASGSQREEAFGDARMVMKIGRETGVLSADPVTFGTLIGQRGGIVGVCNLVDAVRVNMSEHRMKGGQCIGCGWKELTVEDLLKEPMPSIPDCGAKDPWAFGPLGLVLADVRPLPFVPFKGALGFFDVPDELVPEAL
jgi:hypothetical protein